MMHVFNHTPHINKQIVKLLATSHTTSIVLGEICRSIKPQNGPTRHEHVIQGLHIALGVVLPSHQNCFALWTTQSCSLCVNPTKTSHAYRYAITTKFKWTSKAPLPFGSSSSLWKFPLPVLFRVHPQNIPTKYLYLQRYGILVLPSNPPFHAI